MKSWRTRWNIYCGVIRRSGFQRSAPRSLPTERNRCADLRVVTVDLARERMHWRTQESIRQLGNPRLKTYPLVRCLVRTPSRLPTRLRTFGISRPCHKNSKESERQKPTSRTYLDWICRGANLPFRNTSSLIPTVTPSGSTIHVTRVS